MWWQWWLITSWSSWVRIPTISQRCRNMPVLRGRDAFRRTLASKTVSDRFGPLASHGTNIQHSDGNVNVMIRWNIWGQWWITTESHREKRCKYDNVADNVKKHQKTFICGKQEKGYIFRVKKWLPKSKSTANLLNAVFCKVSVVVLGLRPFHDSKAISSSTSSQVMAKKDRSSSNHVSNGLQCVYKDVWRLYENKLRGYPQQPQRFIFTCMQCAQAKESSRYSNICCTHPKTEAHGSNHHLEGSCFQFINHICHLIKTESWISWILPSSVGADGHRIFFEKPSSATTQCGSFKKLSHFQRHKLPSGTAALEPARFCCAQRTMFSPDGSAALRSLVRANPMCCTAHPKTEADGSNHHLEGSCFQFIDHICHLIKTESWISWIIPSSVGADGHRIFFENPSPATTQPNKPASKTRNWSQSLDNQRYQRNVRK